jgi:hypothetical protein
MKRFSIFITCCFLVSILTGCPSPPPSFEIAKIWILKTAKENGVVVYTRGATTNLKSRYESFRLDLSQSSKVFYQDFDEIPMVGNWQLSSDGQTLTLVNLVPIPTGTNGEIKFTLGQNPTNELLKLTRTTTNTKTGGTINEYELIPKL